jgi:hypothetical protein
VDFYSLTILMREKISGAASRACAVCAVVALLGSWNLTALAQADPTEDDRDVLNYAFASQLGSGIYKSSGRVVQVYRIPISYSLRPREEQASRFKLVFPLTIGFYDLKSTDSPDPELPEDVGTLSLVPGVEVTVPVSEKWSLTPLASLGMAKDLWSHERVYVYDLGLKSHVVFAWKRSDFTVGNKLVYVGEHTPGGDRDEDFTMFETGLDVRRPLWFTIGGRDVDASLFVMNYLYLEPTKVFVVREEPLEIGTQFEFGFTFGAVVPIRL